MLTLPMHKLALGLFVEIDLHLSETYASTRLSLSPPHINIGADVWGESSIMTGVDQR